MKKRLITLLSFLPMATTVLPIPTAIAESYQPSSYKPSSYKPSSYKPASGQMIVKYHAKPTEARAIQFIKTGASYKGANFEPDSNDGLNFDIVPSGSVYSLEDEENLATQVANDPQVEFAEPDYIMQIKSVAVPQQPPALIGTPNDTHYASQWYLHGNNGINAPAMWAQMTTLEEKVRIAVIDTGYTDDHPEFASVSTRTQFDIIDLPDQRRDGNGYDISAEDPGDWTEPGFCGTDHLGQPIPQTTIDSSWHGSHVASIIGAETHNGEGIAGVLFNQADIMHIRAMGPCGGRISEIVAGMVLASGLPVTGFPYPPGDPVKVINLSLGFVLPFCPESYKTGIRIARARGVIIVVAAGNENIPASNVTPANCPGVITVAATGPTGHKAYYSNYGSQVDIAAPGGEIKRYQGTEDLINSPATDSSALTILPYSNDPNQITLTLHDGILAAVDTGQMGPAAPGYAYYQGTSMAAPIIAAIIAAMARLLRDLNTALALAILQQTAQPFPDGANNECNTLGCGAGIVDAGAAYQMAKQLAEQKAASGL